MSVLKNGHPLKHIFLRWVQPWGPVCSVLTLGRFKHTSRPVVETSVVARFSEEMWVSRSESERFLLVWFLLDDGIFASTP